MKSNTYCSTEEKSLGYVNGPMSQTFKSHNPGSIKCRFTFCAAGVLIQLIIKDSTVWMIMEDEWWLTTILSAF